MSDENKSAPIKEIPYGITGYELIRTENYYYVDKTLYIKTVKNAGRKNKINQIGINFFRA